MARATRVPGARHPARNAAGRRREALERRRRAQGCRCPGRFSGRCSWPCPYRLRDRPHRRVVAYPVWRILLTAWGAISLTLTSLAKPQAGAKVGRPPTTSGRPYAPPASSGGSVGLGGAHALYSIPATHCSPARPTLGCECKVASIFTPPHARRPQRARRLVARRGKPLSALPPDHERRVVASNGRGVRAASKRRTAG